MFTVHQATLAGWRRSNLVRYFLFAALGLCLASILLSQNSGQTTQASTVKTVDQGYHIVHSDDTRPTQATPQSTAKSTKKKSTKNKNAARKY